MPNPFRHPWQITSVGQLVDATGQPLAILRPQTSEAVRNLILEAPFQHALLTAFAQQLGQAHRDETELLDICESALHLLTIGHATSAVELLTAAIANRRGEELPPC